MSKLVLTEEERKSATFLEWDDEALGKAVKAIALICNDDYGKDALKVTGAAVFLVAEAVRNKANLMTLDVKGASEGEQQFGDWKIVVERTDSLPK